MSPIDFQTLLLSPQGRISPSVFGRGLILLTGATLILRILTVYVTTAFELLALALVFSYICLFSKRLHDAGQSGYLWIVFLLGWGIASTVLKIMFMALISPEATAMQSEFQGLFMAGKTEEAFAYLQANSVALQQAMLMPDLLSFLVASAIAGVAAFMLPSDPDKNRYGLPTLGT